MNENENQNVSVNENVDNLEKTSPLFEVVPQDMAFTTSMPVVSPMEQQNQNTEPSFVTPSVTPSVEANAVVEEKQPEVAPAVVESPVKVESPPPTNGVGDGSMVNEKLERVEIDYTPPSNKKLFVMGLLFVLVLGFVIFLPTITERIQEYQSGNIEIEEHKKIITGKLTCTLDTSTANLDKEYFLEFRFTDNLLEKTDFTITTRGDISLDAKTLDDLNATCNALKKETASLDGVGVRCDYTDGKLVERQTYDLAVVNKELLDSAFSEAGGINPEYTYKEDMDVVEKNMNASGYTCSRSS